MNTHMPTFDDYTDELAVLTLLLQPGANPIGDSFWWEQPEENALVYLGEAELHCNARVQLGDITETISLSLMTEIVWSRCGEVWGWCVFRLQKEIFKIADSHPFKDCRHSKFYGKDGSWTV